MRIYNKRVQIAVLFAAGIMVLAVAGCATYESYTGSKASTGVVGKQESAKPKPGTRKVVAIYEFRSSLSEISAKNATDMFTTALVKSNSFAIAERQRLASGVMKEKDLQKSGKAAGLAGKGKLTGADFIFEGTVSESNPGEKASSGGISLGGMSLGSKGSADSIGLDVRIINASTGQVIDSINVRKEIKSSGMEVSGVGSLLRSLGVGKSSSLTPEVQAATTRKEGVDRALREAIEEAVNRLADRYAAD